MVIRIHNVSDLFVGSSAALYGSLRASMNKVNVALAARLTIIERNNTPDASRKLCAPLGVTYIRKTPHTHLVSFAHQWGYLFLGGGHALY